MNVHLCGALWAGSLPSGTPEVFTFGVGILDPMGSAGSCYCPCGIDVPFSVALFVLCDQNTMCIQEDRKYNFFTFTLDCFTT